MTQHRESAPESATSSLTDFLLARIAEDEAAATAIYDHDRWIVEEDDNGDEWVTEVDRADQHWRVAMLRRTGVADHIARHDPARVLAECEARRRIVEYAHSVQGGLERMAPMSQGEWVIERHILGLLALPYADHPDYREEWNQ